MGSGWFNYHRIVMPVYPSKYLASFSPDEMIWLMRCQNVKSQEG